MPRLSHEALVHLVRTAPEMVVDLIRRVLPIAGALQVQPRLSAGELTDLDLAEYRADAVLTLGDPVAEVFVVEAQGDIKQLKRRSWAMYAAGLYARWNRPVLVVIITPSRKVARWAREPIDLGYGRFVLYPLVIGPEQIPVITDLDEARRSPELAVLSVAAHGREPGAELIAFAALCAVRDLDNERSFLYPDFIHALLGDVARAALEKLMDIRNYEYRSEFARKYYFQGKDEGKAEGLTEGLAKALLALLAQRGLAVDEPARARITACADPAELQRWLTRVLDARSLADVFAP
jgi:hypothetical protein